MVTFVYSRRKEKEELERIRNMTEDERQSWLKSNPRVVTNQQNKGTYKFLQKYFHRGVFYLVSIIKGLYKECPLLY